MWVNESQDIIYTIIKTKGVKALKTKYPKINFTQDSDNNTPSVFPTVYCHFMPSREVGQDLEMDNVHAYSCGLQIKVFVTKEMGDVVATDIIYKVLEICKTLRFEVAMMPETFSQADSKYAVMRVRRIVGYNDIIGG